MNECFFTPFLDSQSAWNQLIKLESVTSRVKENLNQATAGILFVDSNRRIISLNRKLIEMWGLPQCLIEEQNDVQAVKFISSRFENPRSFLGEVRKIYEQMDLEIHDLVFLMDGRIFERQTSPQRLEGKIVGRLWRFREFFNYNRLNDLTFLREDAAPSSWLSSKLMCIR